MTAVSVTYATQKNITRYKKTHDIMIYGEDHAQCLMNLIQTHEGAKKNDK